MNLTRLQTFVEVARRGTFAAAADALSFTPSAVSQQMSKLEAELGTHLMEREAGGVQLTEAGRLLHAHALRIVEAVREAHAGLEALDAEQVKRLRLAACPLAAAAVVPRALRLLRRRLPGAELVLEEATAAATRDAVREGRIDVGVWISAGPCDEDPAIVEVVLHREPLQVALPADHPLTRLEQLDAEALAATPLISGDARWRVEQPADAARARRGRRGLRARPRAGGRAAAGRRRAAGARRRPGVGAARGPAGARRAVRRHAAPRSTRCARLPPVSVAHRREQQR